MKIKKISKRYSKVPSVAKGLKQLAVIWIGSTDCNCHSTLKKLGSFIYTLVAFLSIALIAFRYKYLYELIKKNHKEPFNINLLLPMAMGGKISNLTLYEPNSFFFRDITHKIGFFRLPTHIRNAHGKFFLMIPS